MAEKAYEKPTLTISGKSQMGKGYKYFSEAYIHGLRVVPTGNGDVRVTALCYRSQRKNESPHQVEIYFSCDPLTVETATCSCAIGQCHSCGHITGVMYQIANYKTLGVTAIPDDVCKTSLPQTWHLPRGEKIKGAQSDNIVVQGYDTDNPTRITKGVQSNLYNPLQSPLPPIQNLVDSLRDKLIQGTIINDDSHTSFPDLPLNNSIGPSSIPSDLSDSQKVNLEALSVTYEQSIEIEKSTQAQSSDPKWRKVRQSRLTASVAGSIIKKKRGFENYATSLKTGKKITTAPMRHGLACEPTAAQVYADMQDATVNMFRCGIVISPFCSWLGASPDRKLYHPSRTPPYGLLEIKCPTNPKSRLDYLHVSDGQFQLKTNHNIYYQIQMQLAVTGLTWCDLFVWHEEETGTDEGTTRAAEQASVRRREKQSNGSERMREVCDDESGESDHVTVCNRCGLRDPVDAILGAVDGTLIPIKRPSPNEEAAFVFRKGYHAINVQAICDSSLRFTNVVVKWPGSTHDTLIWSNSQVGIKMEETAPDGWLLGDSG
ncbi:uncharacterized protein LOC124285440 [Haliotis rubra]|uniref:uncharacterized protein LOC124285440 n=1 Tax=Haliotis rubra TaxID=36100 RepID=UPI001EE5C742|nr:uncharacterized protein LOC124285440 [Haliotis rubra]